MFRQGQSKFGKRGDIGGVLEKKKKKKKRGTKIAN
jgi:hypothetical protein